MSILIPKVGSREIKLLKVLIVSCAVYPGFVQSQDITRAEDLVRQLEVKPSPDQRIQTRGIVVSVPNADQGRVSFNTIQFEYDSARLTDDSTAQLTELGVALTDERLSGKMFVIEGHADAHGDDHYNKALSLRRAAAVRDFLVGEFGIAENRLRVVGYGEERPKNPDPYDPENRRVDVVNAGAGQ